MSDDNKAIQIAVDTYDELVREPFAQGRLTHPR